MIYQNIKAENLVKYILTHGHRAHVISVNSIVKISATSDGQDSPDIIEADYHAVREWLGY